MAQNCRGPPEDAASGGPPGQLDVHPGHGRLQFGPNADACGGARLKVGRAPGKASETTMEGARRQIQKQAFDVPSVIVTGKRVFNLRFSACC